MFEASASGTYTVKALVRTQSDCRLRVQVGGNDVITDVPPTGGTLTEVTLCEIEIPDPGVSVLTFRAVPEVWDSMELGTVTLKKQ
jgi:hypothetical protein